MLITYTTNSLQTYILNIVSQAHFVWVRKQPLLIYRALQTTQVEHRLFALLKHLYWEERIRRDGKWQR